MLLSWLLIGALIGAALIVYNVGEIISRLKIPEFVRSAIKQSGTTNSQELLAKALQVTVTEIGDNYITLDALAKGCEAQKIKLTGTGVESGIRVGMKVTV